MKRIIFIITVFSLFACSSSPEIIRRMMPVHEENIEITGDHASQQIENITISIEYMNRKKLFEIAKENNPYVDDDGGPILSAFRIVIENKRDTKIFFDPENAVLLDGLGNQFNALNYETFKELYPSSIYQQYEYSFIFNRYYTETYYTDDYHKRKKAAKSLFKGGAIYPKVRVEGILPFQRVSEQAREITIILPDVILYRTNADKNSKDMQEDKKLEFTFKFRQKIVRIK
ncbi:MAG: hypothetical protein JW827_02385 [Spirochaetes bacterium]|nr:hypothetical protein [Spirochaetota bacterium]